MEDRSRAMAEVSGIAEAQAREIVRQEAALGAAQEKAARLPRLEAALAASEMRQRPEAPSSPQFRLYVVV